MENSPNDSTPSDVPLTDSDTSPVALPDGKERIPLGSGVITNLLGRGGSAAVYEIWNPQLEIYRAVKLINPNAIDVAHQRFQTEFKISAKLKHPNIVEIHGVGEWRGLPYIEMEKIDGMGLDRIISQRGALPPSVCTSVGVMICRALDYAHTRDLTIYGKCYQGVIHRDLKPHNIMVCRSGTVKLMDFGTARPIDATFKTMDGLISGTLQFLSPEQLEKGTLDFRTDLYSLGVTLYEMITGVNPFPQTSFIDLVSHKSKNKFQPLESFPVELPRRLKHIIYQCMHYDPLKRADSAAVLLKELTNIHQSLTSESPEAIMARLISDAGGKKVIVSSRRRHPLRLVAATVSLGFFAFCFYRFGMPDEPKLFLRSSAFAAYSSIHGGLLRLIPKPSGAAPSTGQSAGIPVGKSPDSAAQAQPPLTAASLPGGNTPKSLRGGNLKSKRIKTLMESLKVEYGTEDNLVIMEKAWQAKNYSTVLTIYDFLTPEQARSEQALIFKMRAYDSIGDTEQSAEFLENTNCNDGEFYLAKARLAFRNNNIPGCKLMLAISLSSPHALIDYDVLKREVYFMTALCATAQFDAEPNEQSYKDALDAWWQLKSVLRSDPDHPYNKKAASELQRLAKEMQKG